VCGVQRSFTKMCRCWRSHAEFSEIQSEIQTNMRL
jgi:hypothetical protein